MRLELLVLTTMTSLAFGAQLQGDHVCQKEMRYPVNVTQHFTRNATVRSYEWCLQVPPRCSTFKYALIHETRIVEEEQVEFVDVCCPGFTLNKNTTACVPECKTCLNGECDEDGKCYCHPGYRGDHCEKQCDSTRWGRYCRYHCTCLQGNCDPQTGHCSCFQGWTGLRCESPCQEGFYGHECRNSCTCERNEHCNAVNGECSWTIVEPKAIAPKVFRTFDVITVNNKLAPVASPPPLLASSSSAKTVEIYILTSTDRNVVSEETLWRQQSSVEDEVEQEERAVVQQAVLLSGVGVFCLIGAIVVVSVLVIVYVIFVALVKSRTKPAKEESTKVTSRSIFHSPLPEVPRYDSPTLSSSLEISEISDTAFQTEINFTNSVANKTYSDEMKLFYDHPPSTGSYRAAIAPEPETVQPKESEPLYDEIPNWAVPVDKLYANTSNIGNTRF